MKTNSKKSELSRAFGRSYLVFDQNGVSHAVADAKACSGEIWLSGRCVLPAPPDGNGRADMANLTKNDLARVIAQALYAMKALPAADDRRVLKIAKRSKEILTLEHRMAMRVLQGDAS